MTGAIAGVLTVYGHRPGDITVLVRQFYLSSGNIDSQSSRSGVPASAIAPKAISFNSCGGRS
ncbi:hypothetical protein QUB63_10290 [Microcoleus sp. ARI1-B5]|uniref:hypothetical protein n=1 Tax=unclassified Microcoleus TaxID=2642155 RepID=UPI002FD310F3